jgi:Uma2 family endonuclease
MPLRQDQLADFDGRLEYWEARTETAWVLAEPTGGIHESTSRRLPELARLIATVRGSPIRAFGSVDLRVNDDAGRANRIMQADETLYLHPRRARMPSGPLVIGVHDLPDIVLEVDHTTDIRRGKLPLYEGWGFPELWMLVPPAGATRRRPAGVTIHRLRSDRYDIVPESEAFPGWTASEIHVALTEPLTTERTCRVLERVGRDLGTREGTGPQDDPLLRVLGDRERATRRAESQAEGRAGDRTDERAAGQAELVRAMLVERGMAVSESFTARAAAAVDRHRGAPRMAAAALACADEADFWRRLDRP